MFWDLVGSTALSSAWIPKTSAKWSRRTTSAFAETVQRFGGFVAAYTGHGAIVYLGYPKAHEDDAERGGEQR